MSPAPETAPKWSDPGVEQVAPGVHRIPLPLPTDGLKAVNVYALETDTGLTCIDAGWAVESSRDLLGSSLRSIGYDVGDITRFLVTHAHRDHYTHAVTVRRELGRATVDLGIGEKATLDLFNSGELDHDPTVPRLELAGAHDLAGKWRAMFEGRDLDLSAWAYPDRWLDGEHFIDVGDRTLQAVPTPGHTAGHQSLVVEVAAVAILRQRTLSDVDNEEGRVEAAFLHLGQIHLRVEPLRVVAFGREVAHVDVVVRVERDHPLVNGSRFGDDRRVRRLRAGRRYRAERRQQQQAQEPAGRTSHGTDFARREPAPVSPAAARPSGWSSMRAMRG